MKNLQDKNRLKMELFGAVYKEKGWDDQPKDLRLLIENYLEKQADESKNPKRDMLNPFFYRRIKKELHKIVEEYRLSHGTKS